ncbi:hypothetical protein Cni_G09421 [Canna indica]|uniref:Uncharacterized protein n=1 Tax=Canna indica TaxID=4628 RepID=A0AAQ3K2H1_9LILI|nr:hypothetical protein Cni_G09421 [Canna indica]
MAAHVLIFPFPLQGHINSMLKLAELLSLAGLHVTFLNTDHNHRLIVRHSAAYTRLASCPRLRFRSIPDGFDDDGHRSVSRLLDLAESLRTRAAVFYKDLLLELVSGDAGGQGWPALTCVIADGILPFAVDVAIGLGVPALFFRTSSACSVWSYFCIPKLFQIGDLPFPESMMANEDDADLDEPIRSLPGMEGFLRRRDLPVYCRNAKDSAEPSLQALCSSTANTPRARAFILNTFEALEPSALFHIRSYCPNTYAIGPLHALLAKLHCEENTAPAEMAATARKSVDAGGSSFLELEKLIQEIKSMRRATEDDDINHIPFGCAFARSYWELAEKNLGKIQIYIEKDWKEGKWLKEVEEFGVDSVN